MPTPFEDSTKRERPFSPEQTGWSAHVIPALIRKFHQAKQEGSAEVVVWGTGKPRREFLYVDDVAEAIVFLFENVDAKTIYDLGVPHVNIGTGNDLEIGQLAELISSVIDYRGTIKFDPVKPDGTPRKLLDVGRMDQLGWKYKTELKEGLEQTYDWFLNSEFANN